jgi:hypothetical protein
MIKTTCCSSPSPRPLSISQSGHRTYQCGGCGALSEGDERIVSAPDCHNCRRADGMRPMGNGWQCGNCGAYTTERT